MYSIARFRGSDLSTRHWLVKLLNKLCLEEPLSTHCYVIYYLIHEPSRSEIIVLTRDNNMETYSLIWYGGRFSIQDIYEIYIWNTCSKILEEIEIPANKRADIQLSGIIYNGALSNIIERFRELGFQKFYIDEFYDMICDHGSFKPYPYEKQVIKLDEKHAELYRDLEVERGIEISIEEAREILKTYTHYGVIVDNVLASIAATYIELPRLHIVGGVFTRRKYRGRGYAKAVVSALTRRALNSNCLVGLHVEVDNEPAIKAYTKLGYRVIRKRKWIFAYP